MTAVDELALLVPQQRRPEPPSDDLRVKVVAVAVARPDLPADGVAELLRRTGVEVSPALVRELLRSVDLDDPADRADLVAVMAARRSPVTRTALAVLRVGTTLLVTAAVALLLGLAVLPRTGLYRTSTMLTGSMAPGIPVGAAVLGTPEPLSSVRVGQVVSLTSPEPGHPVYSHRVVEVVPGPDGRIGLRTKGDANLATDPWISYPRGEVWVVRTSVPGLGSLVRALQGPVVHVALVLALPLLVAGWLLVLLWRPRKARPCGDTSS